MTMSRDDIDFLPFPGVNILAPASIMCATLVAEGDRVDEGSHDDPVEREWISLLRECGISAPESGSARTWIFQDDDGARVIFKGNVYMDDRIGDLVGSKLLILVDVSRMRRSDAEQPWYVIHRLPGQPPISDDDMTAEFLAVYYDHDVLGN
jgi:hypothetical protein